jgi:xylan 1,4-beta-xylosidase
MERHRAHRIALVIGCLMSACADEDGTRYPLVIETRGPGTTDPAPGTYLLEEGSTVEVTAAPDAGMNFLGWARDGAGLSNPVTLRMDGPMTLEAAFGVAFELATYQNPVLPGDHPDLNIYREGGDFYLVGSNFQMMPAFEILHSTDLVHWERLTRVVSSSAAALVNQTSPGQGTWGGFIVKAGEVYRVYFAVQATQYFSSAPSLAGPWSEPVKVDVFPYTPPGSDIAYERGTGSDNSVFVDPESGKTYMLIKNGICKWDAEHPNEFAINLATEIDPDDGMLRPETTIDLSFVNWDQTTGGCGDFSDPDYSKWAEGPTMVKRGDWYYYFISTHTACGGQMHAWASRKLVDSAPADWTWLGYVLTGTEPYAGVQHSTAPLEIEDGSWWVFAHSYDCSGVRTNDYSNGNWMGLGREGLLLQVTWVDKDVGGQTIPVPEYTLKTRHLPAPDLPRSGSPFLVPVNDEFASDQVGSAWTTYGPSEEHFSAAERPGWLRIDPPGQETTWVVQKDALRASSMVAKMEFVPEADGDAAGIRVGNGYWRDEQVLSAPTWMTSGEGFLLPAIHELSLARVMEDGADKIRLAFRSRSVRPLVGDQTAYAELDEPVVVADSVAAPPGETVWLKLVRQDHRATGWFSTDRLSWTQVGGEIDILALDSFYAMAHTWVGNQAGMFASRRAADFDLFIYRDGFTEIPAAEANQSSADVVASESAGSVLGGLEDGDHAMFGGVHLGSGGLESGAIELRAASAGSGALVEIWIDPLAGGEAIGSCELPSTGSWEEWATVTCPVKPTAGSHDVYLKIKGGTGELVRLAWLRFAPAS